MDLKTYYVEEKKKKKKKKNERKKERKKPKSWCTSPFARSVFILSRKLDSSMLDSSKMKTLFSFLQPARLRTARKSSSKSAAKYFR